MTYELIWKKSAQIWRIPAVAVFLVGTWGVASADTSDVKLPPPVVIGKSAQALQRRSALLQSLSLRHQARRARQSATAPRPGDRRRAQFRSHLQIPRRRIWRRSISTWCIRSPGRFTSKGRNGATRSPSQSSTSRPTISVTPRSCWASASCATYSRINSLFTGS